MHRMLALPFVLPLEMAQLFEAAMPPSPRELRRGWTLVIPAKADTALFRSIPESLSASSKGMGSSG